MQTQSTPKRLFLGCVIPPQSAGQLAKTHCQNSSQMLLIYRIIISTADEAAVCGLRLRSACACPTTMFIQSLPLRPSERPNQPIMLGGGGKAGHQTRVNEVKEKLNIITLINK